jgi:hypothetical protein
LRSVEAGPNAAFLLAKIDLRVSVGVTHQASQPPTGQVAALTNGLLTNGVRGSVQAMATLSETCRCFCGALHHRVILWLQG